MTELIDIEISGTSCNRSKITLIRHRMLQNRRYRIYSLLTEKGEVSGVYRNFSFFLLLCGKL